MTRRISATGLAKIKDWEKLRLSAYNTDGSGTWTIGYGHTGLVRGKKIDQFTEITKAEAESLLLADLDDCEMAVERLVKVPLTDGERDALIIFQFNTGGLRFKGRDSLVLKAVNEGRREDVPTEMMRWDKVTNKKTGKKEISAGLQNRRAKEVALWTSGKAVAPSSAPVTPSAAPIASKENVAFAAGIVGTAVPAVATLDGSSPIAYVIAGMVGVSFIVALVLFFKRRGA